MLRHAKRCTDRGCGFPWSACSVLKNKNKYTQAIGYVLKLTVCIYIFVKTYMQQTPIDNDFNVIFIISFMHRDRKWMKIEALYNNIPTLMLYFHRQRFMLWFIILYLCCILDDYKTKIRSWKIIHELFANMCFL